MVPVVDLINSVNMWSVDTMAIGDFIKTHFHYDRAKRGKLGFIRGMRAEIEARAIEGNTKNGAWRHGSDVQCVNKSGPDQTNPIRAGHAIGASQA